jgi:hypothetical protein
MTAHAIPPRPLVEVVADMLAYQAEDFDGDKDISATDLMDAFTGWRAELAASLRNHTVTPEISEVVSGLRGAISACLTQIEQMKGLFDDEDGAIARAVDEAEHELEITGPYAAAPLPVRRIAITMDGGLIQSIYSPCAMPDVEIVVFDHDVDGAQSECLCDISFADGSPPRLAVV